MRSSNNKKRFPFWGLLSIYINDQFSCGRIAQYGFFLLVHNRSFIKENTGKLFSVSVDTGCHLGAEKMNRNQTGGKKKLKTMKLVTLQETSWILSQSQPLRQAAVIGTLSIYTRDALSQGMGWGSSAGPPWVIQCHISPGLVPLCHFLLQLLPAGCSLHSSAFCCQCSAPFIPRCSLTSPVTHCCCDISAMLLPGSKNNR